MHQAVAAFIPSSDITLVIDAKSLGFGRSRRVETRDGTVGSPNKAVKNDVVAIRTIVSASGSALWAATRAVSR